VLANSVNRHRMIVIDGNSEDDRQTEDKKQTEDKFREVNDRRQRMIEGSE
jgi:hypothetical protein